MPRAELVEKALTMRQTLFVISHELITTYLLPLWIVLIVVGVGLHLLRRGWSKELWGWLWVFLAGTAIIQFVLPAVEVQVPDPDDPSRLVPLGLPIRGFGVMFLLATLSGVGLTLRRAAQMGVDRETVLSLIFAMFICGIVGARLFYVIEYWDQFQGDDPWKLIARVLNTTQGGIVVYGSLIGGLLAALIYCSRTQLPMLATADLLAPGMALGLAIGRLGCFLNGCCFGGVCDWPVAVEFPAGSPPYLNQIETGVLLGLKTKGTEQEGWLEVVEVKPDSYAAAHGVEPTDRIQPPLVTPYELEQAQAQTEPGGPVATWRLRTADGSAKPSLVVPLVELPRRSQGVHPTQLYSSINAFLLCLFLWFYYPVRYGDGEVIGMALILYPIARVLLEAIRVDEAGQFGTELSISQWTSLPMLLLGVGLVWVARRQQRPLAYPPQRLPAVATARGASPGVSG